MAKYSVDMPFTGVMNFLVEAGTEEEAIAKVWESDFRIDAKGDGEIIEFDLTEIIVEGNVFRGCQNEVSVTEEPDA